MKQREGYKKTKIGWIPEDWKVKTLNDITRKKIVYGIVQAGPHIEDGIPYIKSKDIRNEINIEALSRTSIKLHAKKHSSKVLPGDIVFSLRGNIGETIIVPKSLKEANLTQGTARISVKEEYSTKFVQHELSNPNVAKRIGIVSKGSTFKEISLEELRKIQIPCPKLIPEQNKIASILTTVDDKISYIKTQIQQTEQLKKGLMEKLLTEGIGHTEFKDTKIGRIPVSWEVSTLGKHILLISGQHINSENYNEEGDGIPYITGPADYPNGKVIPSKFTEKPQAVCEANDILITCKGSGAGSLTIADEDYCISRQIMAIRPQSIVQKFTLPILERAQNSFRKNAVGLIPGISRPDLINFSIPYPPIEEQTQIASILSTVDDKIEVLTQKKDQYQTLKKGLSQQLLTGQMRVRV